MVGIQSQIKAEISNVNIKGLWKADVQCSSSLPSLSFGFVL